MAHTHHHQKTGKPGAESQAAGGNVADLEALMAGSAASGVEEVASISPRKPSKDGESADASAAGPKAALNGGASPGADAGQDETKKAEALRQQVSELGAKLEAAQDKYLRLMAEFDNYKRRTSREYEQVREQATERLMIDLVEVKDNFDRALLPGKEAIDYDTFHKGMQLIDDKLVSVLQKHGLSAFGAAGDAFNPELHEALMKQPHEQIAEDHVAQVFDKGYKLKGKVIKHARVVVSSGKPHLPAAEAPPGQRKATAAPPDARGGDDAVEPEIGSPGC